MLPPRGGAAAGVRGGGDESRGRSIKAGRERCRDADGRTRAGDLAGACRGARAAGVALPPFDVHCPLLSLALIFGTTIENIPGLLPYLRADAAAVEKWKLRLAADSSRRKVGVVWAGNVRHVRDRDRSMTLSELAPL